MNIITKKYIKLIKENAFIVLLFVLVFFLVSILLYNMLPKYIEGFIENVTIVNKDCSDCRVQPSGNCVNIPVVVDDKIKQDTSNNQLVFCEWQDQCSITNQLTYSDVSNEYIDYKCCNDSTWYSQYTSTINEMSNNILQPLFSRCNYIFDEIDKIDNSDELKNTNISPYEIVKCRKFMFDICNNELITNREYGDKPGLLFMRKLESITSIYNQDIIDNPNITKTDLTNYINRRYPLIEDWIKENKGSNKLKEYRKIYASLNSNSSNIDVNRIKFVLYNDYIKDYESRYINRYDIEKRNYKWQLLDKTNQNVVENYILDEGEFFNCFGDISSLDMSTNLFDICNQDSLFNQPNQDTDTGYFGVDDKYIKTIADYSSYTDPIDRDMENLPRIDNQTTMVPVSVINQYLSFINNFYNRQINNMMGPETHAQKDKIKFNNNQLDNIQDRYFTYSNNLTDTSYQTIKSITGDNSFNYTGPEPYFDTNYTYF